MREWKVSLRTRTPLRRKNRGTDDLGSGEGKPKTEFIRALNGVPPTTQGGDNKVDIVAKSFTVADAQLLRRDDRQPTMGYIGAKVCAVVVVDEDANLGWQAF